MSLIISYHIDIDGPLKRFLINHKHMDVGDFAVCGVYRSYGFEHFPTLAAPDSLTNYHLTFWSVISVIRMTSH